MVVRQLLLAAVSAPSVSPPAACYPSCRRQQTQQSMGAPCRPCSTGRAIIFLQFTTAHTPTLFALQQGQAPAVSGQLASAAGC